MDGGGPFRKALILVILAATLLWCGCGRAHRKPAITPLPPPPPAAPATSEASALERALAGILPLPLSLRRHLPGRR